MTRSLVAKSEKLETAVEESAFIMSAPMAAELAALPLRAADFALATAASCGSTDAHASTNNKTRANLMVDIFDASTPIGTLSVRSYQPMLHFSWVTFHAPHCPQAEPVQSAVAHCAVRNRQDQSSTSQTHEFTCGNRYRIKVQNHKYINV